MLGLIVILMISWGLLYFSEGKDIKVLGFEPLGRRLIELLVGFMVGTFLIVLIIVSDSMILHVKWEGQNPIEGWKLIQSLYYHIRSALTEDLIFRGALMYILMNRIGSRRAILISAVGFGIYHLFSYSMIGGPIVPIIYVLLITALMGGAYAFTYVKTGSILMSLGMHASWNFIHSLFYNDSPYGQILLKEADKIVLTDYIGLFYPIATGIIPPILIILIVCHYYPEKSHLI